MEKFEKLGLSPKFVSALQKAGFTEPTEIQEKVIPLAMAGKDVIGSSATGSGKTLAFSTAIIENLQPNNHVQALIMTPTRELAEQVATSIKKFSENKNLNILAVYGGVGMDAQIRKLGTTDILVGTPGRILDHLRRRTLRLNEVKFLVLDEVDRMLDMGFHRDVEAIVKECPKERQTMLFSATISADLDHLAKKYTRNAENVSVENQVDPLKLTQIYYDVPANKKFALLVHLLKQEGSELVMVFCSTRSNADFVTHNLIEQGIKAKVIHGGLDQKKRLNVLKEFHEKNLNVLVCTDVAARGLDIKGVSHVYNYDLPKESKDYIHRIGRTARAGKEGKAISILSSRDYENFSNIQSDEEIKIKQEELPDFPDVRMRIDFDKKRRFSGRGDFGRGRDNRGSGRGFRRGGFGGGRHRDSGGNRDERPRRDNRPHRSGGRFQRDNREGGHRSRDDRGHGGRSHGGRDSHDSMIVRRRPRRQF